MIVARKAEHRASELLDVSRSQRDQTDRGFQLWQVCSNFRTSIGPQDLVDLAHPPPFENR
jgi:hypothetical protein